jgi:hypothetical protein
MSLPQNVVDGAGNLISLEGESGILIAAAPNANINIETSENGEVFVNGSPFAGLVQFVSVALTNSEILNLGTTPIAIVPAQGPGTVILVLAATINTIAGGTPFAGNSTIAFQYAVGTPASSSVSQANSGLNSSVNAFCAVTSAPLNDGSGSFPRINLPVYISMGSNPTSGTGTAIVTMLYVVISG